MPSAPVGERGALLKGTTCAREEGEVLLWAGDALGSKGKGYPKTYPTIILWDVLIAVVFIGPICFASVEGTILLLQPPGWGVLLLRLWQRVIWFLSIPMFLAIVLVLAMMPQRVTREVDSLTLEFPLHRKVVPLDEVTELAVLDHGMYPLVRLLQRTGTFPFGSVFRCFCGLPSNGGVMFVLITAGFWSFIFCLADPVQFLVDNQRPLDLTARYRTTNNVRVRAGESLQTPKVAYLRRGQYLRVKEQRGRRVLVEFEDGKTRGWMSYVNQLGRFLLAKEQASSVPAPGTVGASSLTGTYGAAIELPSLSPQDDEE